ncbi:MAG: hypothetical protein ACRC0S_08005 [Fusobacteriaceae bacterium]
MARVENFYSSELERSMNMQGRVMTFEEHLRHMEVIDKLDDERIAKSHGAFIWYQSMMSNFEKRLEEVLIDSEINILKLIELKNEIKDFNKKYIVKLKEIHEMELYFENEDDKLREYLIEYSVKCRKELRIENSSVEKKLLLQNLLNKKRQV